MVVNKTELTRKMTCFKTQLYNSGFYDTKIVLRNKTYTDGTDNIFYSDSVIDEITDTIKQAIVEFGPEIYTFDNYVETIDGDVRISVLSADADAVQSADEIWIGVEFTTAGAIVYDGSTTNFTQGTVYQIKSDKKSMFDEEHIYILKSGSKLNES